MFLMLDIRPSRPRGQPPPPRATNCPERGAQPGSKPTKQPSHLLHTCSSLPTWGEQPWAQSLPNSFKLASPQPAHPASPFLPHSSSPPPVSDTDAARVNYVVWHGVACPLLLGTITPSDAFRGIMSRCVGLITPE